MNSIAKTDSLIQFMRLVQTARDRTAAPAALKGAPLRKAQPYAALMGPGKPSGRSETRMMPVVNQPAAAQAKGRIVGNYFDAYA
ncbi:MAG: hypothetical protein PHC61_08290 [Chitinivibrionales bacterium]|nr:hypothetical protein [Chitinivibrionales bacterium]